MTCTPVTDNPLKSYKEDLLGRTEFAQNIANLVLSYTNKESLVIGLQSEWGNGKTSLMNFILEFISEKTSLINFFRQKYPDIFKKLDDINMLLSKQINYTPYNNESTKLSTTTYIDAIIKTVLIIIIVLFAYNFDDIVPLNKNWEIISLIENNILIKAFLVIYLSGIVILLPVYKLSNTILIPIKAFLSLLIVIKTEFINIFKTQKAIKNYQIIHFNPWLISDSNKLAEQFFATINKTLNKEFQNGEIKELTELITKYSKKISNVDVNAINNLLLLDNKTIFDLKAEIIEKLSNLNYKIIIVIDDIDRLRNEEIILIFKLVRSVADFPNTIYFLLYDDRIVANAFDADKTLGKKFIEKIIQVPLTLPEIPETMIQSYLSKELDALIKEFPHIEKQFDQAYWINLTARGYSKLFSNVRDVHRYINVLKFLLTKNLSAEINTVDFFIIIALQIFEPHLYYFILEYKKDLLRSLIPYSHLKDNDNRNIGFKSKFTDINTKNNKLSENNFKETIKIMFPRTEAVFGNTNYGSDWETTWRREKRIASNEYFDKYFIFQVPENQIYNVEVNKILELIKEGNYPLDSIKELNKNNKITDFLMKIFDKIDEINDIGLINQLICYLNDFSDFIDNKEEGMLLFYNNSMRITNILELLFLKYESPEKVVEIIKDTFKNNLRSVNSSILTIKAFDYYLQEKLQIDKNEVDQNNYYIQVKNIACEKLYIWANNDLNGKYSDYFAFSGKLSDHSEFLSILYRWRDYGDQIKLNEYIKKLTESDDGLISFLVSTFSKVRSQGYGSYVCNITLEFRPETVKDFIKPEDYINRVNNIKNSDEFKTLNEIQQKAINDFLKAFGK